MSTETPTAAAADPHASTLESLRGALGEGGFTTSSFADNLRIHVAADRLMATLGALKAGGFNMLTELGGVDYLGYPEPKVHRFEVHYVLRDLDANRKVIVKVGVDDPGPTLPSAWPLWPGADWMEREIFDLYGIAFDGHPDLRRILMPEEFTAHPLRKDYPLRGRGERHNFPRLTREQS